MRHRIALIPALFAALAAAAAQPEDVLAKALQDELARSMKQLQLERLDKPYFIAYRVSEADARFAGASFGSLVNATTSHARTLLVEVRVGDYKLDNSNFFSPLQARFAFANSLPLDNDYNELRREIWLATDAAYKRSLEELAQKRAALQNKNLTEDVPDFSQEPAVSVSEDLGAAALDAARMDSLVRRLSSLFREIPDAHSDTVNLSVSNRRTWYVDSEGRFSTRVCPSVALAVRAVSQAEDGTPLFRNASFHARSLDGLPSNQELERRVRQLGADLKALRAASSLESYNGPVLFEGEAAPLLFDHVFVPDLLATRRPVTDGVASSVPSRMIGRESPFLDKLGARVLPDFLTVVDRPSLSSIAGQPLYGGIKVDDQGVPAQETVLVEKGVLKTLLSTRTPVRRIERSNGHARSSGPAPSNLVVAAENGLSSAQLREKLLGMIKDQGKEYGVIVRSVGAASQIPGAGEPAIRLVLAYKAFPDGKEELVRNIEVSGLSTSTFKEILAASQDPNVFTLDSRGAVVSYAVPALLFEDVTIKKVSRELPKPPVARHPFFDR